ncbi:MAG: alpha/beta hydrolase [Dyadobacter sp.]|uniref:alpha/beta fold hydrolase n=1 Tax=Dyadobacter sp. TaxID=1914288 RepID=UPI0032645736
MPFKTTLLSLLTVGLLLSACQTEDPSLPGALVPKTVDQDATTPSIRVNGTHLHAETFGNPTDPMLVVLHGGPGSDYRYLLNAQAFAREGYYVIFYDQRGSGLSKRHDKATYRIDIMEEDLGAVIAHYRTSASQKVFLLGHSWGAMLASAYINANPTKISGAILAEPGGLVYADILDYVKRARSWKLNSETFSDVMYADQFFTGRENNHEILDYRLALQSKTEGANDAPTGDEGPMPSWRHGAIVNQALFELAEKQNIDWTTNLKQYKTRVLFVYSANNRAYGLAHAQHVSSAYPTVQLLRIDEAGHNMLSFPIGWASFYPIALTYLETLNKP